MSTVQVSRRSDRKGARLHPAGGCHWSRVLHTIDGSTVDLTADNAHRVCRTAKCRTALAEAITVAQRENNTSPYWSQTLDSALVAIVEALGLNVATLDREAEYAAERAAIAARWVELDARQAPAVVEVAPAAPMTWASRYSHPTFVARRNSHRTHTRRSSRIAA